MSFHTWLTFLMGVVVICGSPGPNMLRVMITSVQYGLKRAIATMLGCFTGVFILIGASVAGVGVFLQAFPAAFDALRYAGATYLICLGIKAWRTKPVLEAAENAPIGATSATPKALYYSGLLVGISNPKAMLFATAFFPQFISRDADEATQLAILLATFGVVEFIWYWIYALGGSRLTRAMRSLSVQKTFNRVTGGVFMMFAAAIAACS